MPTLVRTVTQRINQLGRDLETRDIGFDELSAAGAESFSQSKNRWNDRRGGLAHQSETVVEVERVRRRAVGKRRL